MSATSQNILGIGRTAAAWLCLGLMTLATGCEYVRPTMNSPLEQFDPDYGYRSTNLPPSTTGSSDGLFIVSSFSGGGARASALAYGGQKKVSGTIRS